jgi:feruloyl esterase
VPCYPSTRRFVAHTPATRPAPGAYDWLGESLYWLGERLYSHGYQTWCHVVDGELECRPARTWLTARLNGAS